MSEWLSKYWFSVAAASIFIAVAAYRLSQTEAKSSGPNPAIWRVPSLSISLALAALPLAFFVVSTNQATQTALALQAVGLAFVSLLFFLASRFANRLVLFALLCWLSTSSMRPTRTLWTSIYGIVFLGCAIAMFASSVST